MKNDSLTRIVRVFVGDLAVGDLIVDGLKEGGVWSYRGTVDSEPDTVDGEVTFKEFTAQGTYELRRYREPRELLVEVPRRVS